MACFHRWIPRSIDRLKIKVKASGWAVCTHFRRQYPMLLGPGAEKSNMVCRASEISMVEIGGHLYSGSGSGLVCWWVGTSQGSVGKKHCQRTSVFWAMVLTSLPSMLWRGGNVLICWPFWTLESDQISLASVVWWSLLWAHCHLACASVCQRCLVTAWWSSPAEARCAAVWAMVHSSFHQLMP